MSYGKYRDVMFVIGLLSVVLFTSSILELRPSNLSITVPSLNIASATPVSNNTIINTTLSSSNATTILEDSNGTITTIPELEDRRHALLR